MFTTSTALPEFNKRVLLYDARTHKWVIAMLQERDNNRFWVIDPKLFYGVDSDKFTHWTNLPTKPE